MSENRSKTVVIIALCLTLIFMGVGFAALSQTLTINSTGTIEASTNWKVNFASFADSTASLNLENNQGADTTTGNILNTESTVATVSFSVKKPGDVVQYTGSIQNAGQIAAKLSDVTAELDENEYIVREVTIDGIKVPADQVPEIVLEAGESVPVVVTYTYTKTEGEQTLPSTVQTVGDAISFVFVQAY